jgi:23S rRNA pseudouridine1911/1915/1917 synthase
MNPRRLQYEAGLEDVGQRVDKVLAKTTQEISRSRLKKAFDAGKVVVNAVAVAGRYKLHAGDWIEAEIEEASLTSEAPTAQAIGLSILYEDEDLIVINKASGMVTHPGNGTTEDTLVHALLSHCGDQLSSIGAPMRPGIVHRLDKETSGVIVVAKTDSAHLALARAFAGRNLYKRYRALVCGVPEKDTGSCTGAIFRHPVHRIKMAVLDKGRVAHTDWRVLRRFGKLASELECVLHTGRTHQIRVHMSYAGFPLLGDTLYGFKPTGFPMAIPRVMLHAERLHLEHPLTQAKCEFHAPVPDDYETTVAQLQKLAVCGA